MNWFKRKNHVTREEMFEYVASHHKTHVKLELENLFGRIAILEVPRFVYDEKSVDANVPCGKITVVSRLGVPKDTLTTLPSVQTITYGNGTVTPPKSKRSFPIKNLTELRDQVDRDIEPDVMKVPMGKPKRPVGRPRKAGKEKKD